MKSGCDTNQSFVQLGKCLMNPLQRDWTSITLHLNLRPCCATAWPDADESQSGAAWPSKQ